MGVMGTAWRPRRRSSSFQCLASDAELAMAMETLERFEQKVATSSGAELGALLSRALELSDSACFSVSAAEAQYSNARAEYESSFSPLQRGLKFAGRRAKAHRALYVEPCEQQLLEASAVFKKAKELKTRIEVGAVGPATKDSVLRASPNFDSMCTTFLVSQLTSVWDEDVEEEV